MSQAAPAPLASRGWTSYILGKPGVSAITTDRISSSSVQGTWEAMKWARSAACEQGAVGMVARERACALPPGLVLCHLGWSS